jgi:hypothetical protein
MAYRKNSGFDMIPVKAGNFDFNQTLEVETSQKSGRYMCVQPLGGITEDGPYHFYFPPIENQWMIMDKTGIEMEARVVNADGTNLGANDLVAPINNIALSAWREIELYINGQSLGGSVSDNYHYKSYLQSLTSLGSDARKTWLESSAWYLDSAMHGDDMASEGDNSDNLGWKKRCALVSRSSTFSTYTLLPHDFLRASNHLAPGNRLEMKLLRAKNSFILNSRTTLFGSRYKLLISKLVIWVYYVELDKPLLTPRIEMYFITKTEMHRSIIVAGMPEYKMRLIQQGVLPKQVIFAMTYATAAEGEYGRNPFNFLPFDATSMTLYRDGTPFPSRGLQFDFTGGHALCSRAYHWLYEHTGLAGTPDGNQINIRHFGDGAFIIPFNLTPDVCGDFHVHKPTVGSLDIEVSFASPTPTPIAFHYMLCYNKVLVNNREDNTIAFADCVT